MEEMNQENSSKPKFSLGVDKIILTASLIGFLTVSALYANETGFFKKIFSGIGGGSSDKVKLDLYVMSQCPYGVQAEDALKPVMDKMGDAIDLSINYISDDNGDGTFSSLRGEPETQGNIVQLCAKKYDDQKYFDMIICQNKGVQSIPGNWESCAKEVGLKNIDKVKTCFEGQEGKDLLKENIKLAKQVNASGSPTYYIAGELYQGGRDEGSVMRTVCNKINNKHSACSSMAACFTDNDCNSDVAKVGKCLNAGNKDAKCEYSDPKPVNLTVLNDKRCVECGSIAANINDSLKQIFKGLQIKEVDYSDQEGKELVKSMPGVKLPAYLFAANVSDGEGYSNVERYLQDQAGYKVLNVGTTFDPSKEICDNKVDDTGNGKVDCVDSDCAGSTVCRKEISKRLDVFVMSDCPYGNMAEDAMKEVIANFGSNIDFRVNYIATDLGGGKFESLHGDYETQQNKVELCVNKYFPKKNLDFITCINATGDIKNAKWEDCASKLSINTSTISKCATGAEGNYLLSQNVKIASDLGIGASPTWLVNNKYQASGIDAEAIKTAFCQYNPGTPGCEKTLTSSASPSANAGAGCGQ